ncbi:MAG: ATP-binding protein [Bdellovibrionota bacterium]
MDILLISKQFEDRQFVEAGWPASDSKLIYSETPENAMSLVKDPENTRIFVDVSSSEDFENFQKSFKSLVKKYQLRDHVHILSSLDIGDLTFISESELYGHLVTRSHYNEIQRAGKFYGEVIKNLKALPEPDFKLPGLDTEKFEVGHSDNRKSAIEEVGAFLRQQLNSERVAEIITNSVDELLLNAVFDASFEQARSQGKKVERYRSQLFHPPVVLTLNATEDFVAFTVVDHFGSLDRAKLLSHFYHPGKDLKNYDSENEKGAGIGLSVIRKMGGSLLFQCVPNVFTSVTVIYGKNISSMREFKGQFRFFSIRVADNKGRAK